MTCSFRRIGRFCWRGAMFLTRAWKKVRRSLGASLTCGGERSASDSFADEAERDWAQVVIAAQIARETEVRRNRGTEASSFPAANSQPTIAENSGAQTSRAAGLWCSTWKKVDRSAIVFGKNLRIAMERRRMRGSIWTPSAAEWRANKRRRRRTGGGTRWCAFGR